MYYCIVLLETQCVGCYWPLISSLTCFENLFLMVAIVSIGRRHKNLLLISCFGDNNCWRFSLYQRRYMYFYQSCKYRVWYYYDILKHWYVTRSLWKPFPCAWPRSFSYVFLSQLVSYFFNCTTKRTIYLMLFLLYYLLAIKRMLVYF